MNKEDLEKYILKNKGILPLHSRFWKVNAMPFVSNTILNVSTDSNGKVKDLLHKPVSTFFKLRINAGKEVY